MAKSSNSFAFLQQVIRGADPRALKEWFELSIWELATELDCPEVSRELFRRLAKYKSVNTLGGLFAPSDLAPPQVQPHHIDDLANSLVRHLDVFSTKRFPHCMTDESKEFLARVEREGFRRLLEQPLTSLDLGAFNWGPIAAFLKGPGFAFRTRDAFDPTKFGTLTRSEQQVVLNSTRGWIERSLRIGLAERDENAIMAVPLPDDPIVQELDDKFERALATVVRPTQYEGVQLRCRFDRASMAIVCLFVHEAGTILVGNDEMGRILLAGWRAKPDPFSKTSAVALRAARRLLRTPENPEFQTLVTWLHEPAWMLTIRTFDDTQAAFTPDYVDDPQRRIAFRLTDRGSPAIVPVVQKRGKRGAWSKGTEFAPHRLRELFAIGDPLDRPALEALLFDPEPAQGAEGVRRTLARTLSALVGHPRVFFDETHVAVRRAPASIELVDTPLGLVPKLRIGDQLREPNRVISTVDGHIVDLDKAMITLASLPRAATHFLKAIVEYPAAFPRESWDTLLTRLEGFGTDLPLRLPPSLEGPVLPSQVVPCVRLELDAQGALTVRLRARIPERTGELVPGQGAECIYLVMDGKRRHVQRDLEAEKVTSEAIVETLKLPTHGRVLDEFSLDWIIAPGDDVFTVAEAADKLAPPVETSWMTERLRVVGSVDSARLNLRIRRAGAWLVVGGDVIVDETEVTLAALANAVRQGSHFVSVGHGRFARIAESLRQRLLPVVNLASESKDGLTVAGAALPFVAELVDEGKVMDVSVDLRARILAWRAGQSNPNLPEHLENILRPYQREGFQWMTRLADWGAGAVLADDMGLGKTVMAIAMLETRAKLGPALVIAPTSVGPNWERELERFGKVLKPRAYRGPTRAGLLQNLGEGDLLIASWDTAARDVETLSKVHFATLVLDEAQAAKNASTRRASMARALDADWRVALSGTPIENHLGELWSLFSIVSPGFLGSWDQFRDRFAVPIERDGSDEKRKVLARLLRPFVLRRTKEAVEQDLPPLTETTRWIELSPTERGLYEATRREALADLEPRVDSAKERIVFLVWLTRLRQLACHPKLYLTNSSVGSSKLSAFLTIVDELRESRHRALVFSQFTQHLALVRQALDAKGVSYQYLDGSTSVPERGRRVDAFQAGEGELFLISLKAGGTGLNLTAASHVIHLDPWWNPAVEDQATDRAHRIGQTKPVTVVKLITRGTIEEAMVATGSEKRALAEAVLEGTEAAGRLSTAQLLNLVRSGVVADLEEESDE